MSNGTPVVTVIMPAYNSDKYISEAIDSILNQTFRDFEFIIIDDGSTDKTWDIVRGCARKDDRIIAFRNRENLNNYTCRNKAIKIAKGRYVVWQDSDDISLKDRLEVLVSFMDNNKDVGICGSFMEAFNEKGQRHIRRYSTTDESIRKTIFKYTPIAQPSAIVRKDCYKKVGLYDSRQDISQDLDMTFRIGEVYKLSNIPKVLVLYRESSDSITHKKLKKQITNTLKIRLRYMNSKFYPKGIVDVIALLATFVSQFLPLDTVYRLFYILKNLFLK